MIGGIKSFQDSSGVSGGIPKTPSGISKQDNTLTSGGLGKTPSLGNDDSSKSLYSISRNKRGLKPGPKRIRQTVGKQVGKRSPTKR